MSSPIASPQGPTAPAALSVELAAARAAGGTIQRTAAPQAAVAFDALPASPPPEVLEQMAAAAKTYDALAAQGRELRFARDTQSGRTAIEVRDRAGRLLKTLSPAQALDVAAGGPLE